MAVSAAGEDKDMWVEAWLDDGLEGIKVSWDDRRRGVGCRGAPGMSGWWWSNPPRSKSATLPDFYCLIYTSSDHEGSSLMEICKTRKKKKKEKKNVIRIITQLLEHQSLKDCLNQAGAVPHTHVRKGHVLHCLGLIFNSLTDNTAELE